MNQQPDHLLEAKIRILEQEMIYQHQAYAKAINIVHAYQDVIRAADNLVDLVFDHPFRTASTMGGPFMAAIDNLQQALKHAYDPNGDAE
jgi:hypothetical protein